MTIIRVNPQSVHDYGRGAQDKFATIHTELVALVNDVVAVRYFGPNAVSFKTQCGQIAADCANKLSADLGAIADAIKASTSNIAASLGGQPVIISVEGSTISPPSPQVVDYVDVDTSALSDAVPVVQAHFTAIKTALADHLSSLVSTDWEGNAKIQAVELVSGFTSKAQASADETQTSLVSYINDQVQSVVAADR